HDVRSIFYIPYITNNFKIQKEQRTRKRKNKRKNKIDRRRDDGRIIDRRRDDAHVTMTILYI
ncbi:MAG: hypothetical protein ACI8RD_013732, partial [Bacillariaceae sp.]